MKIVEAIWEKRNLGVECRELHIEDADTAQEIEKACSAVGEKEYMVARVPSANFEAAAFFGQRGYRFIEAAVTLENDLKTAALPPRIMR